VFGKHISEDPEKYFTKDILQQINEYTAKKYKFGHETLDTSEVDEELQDDTVQAD